MTATNTTPRSDALAVLDADQRAIIASSITDVQQASGEIPWHHGEHTDPWNMVEAAMGLTVAGQHNQARAAYEWLTTIQRPDGSWPLRFRNHHIEDPATDTNFTAYLATGVWHHLLATGDVAFAQHLWPTVQTALDYVVAHQQPDGTIPWAIPQNPTAPEPALPALRTGSCSMLRSLDSGLRLAATLHPHSTSPTAWATAATALHHALTNTTARFMPRRRFAMDWYYPVLAGVTPGATGRAALTHRWAEFVVPGLGCRCVTSDPWVTVAETAELAITLCALGDPHRAATLLRDVQFLQHHCGGYATGYVYTDDAIWPEQCTTWTAGAVLLADDAIQHHTAAHNLFATNLTALR